MQGTIAAEMDAVTDEAATQQGPQQLSEPAQVTYTLSPEARSTAALSVCQINFPASAFGGGYPRSYVSHRG